MCICFDENEKKKVEVKLQELADYRHEAGSVDLSENLDDLDPETKAAVLKAIKNAENGTAPKARGQPYMPSSQMANLTLAWGCPPSKFVLADTRMIHDFFDTLRDRYDPKTLCVKFPDVLNDMLSEAGDAAWEFWRSKSLQTAKIFYEQNKVTSSQGIIFVNTHT